MSSREDEKPALDTHAYWNERLERDFSLSGAGHSSIGLSFNRWAYRARRKVLKRELAASGVNPAGASLLELAFGTGFYLDLWRETGVKHVTGFDITRIAVSQARERFAKECGRADSPWRFESRDIGAPLPLLDMEGQYDIATAFDVLFHLVDDAPWQGALDNIARALKPGGHAILFDKFQAKESAVSHVKRRTIASYSNALESRGLEIVRIRPLFVLMNSPSAATGIMRPIYRGLWSMSKMPYRVGKLFGNGVGEFMGGITGAMLYTPELLLTNLAPTGPSTKVMIARKRQLK